MGPEGAEIVTFYEVPSFEYLGTTRVPLPKLYVPTEAFNATEGDLTSLIVYHEANHAKVARFGFGIIDMGYFRHVDDPIKFNLSMFNVVYELEGHKEQIEKGAYMMTPRSLEIKHQEYMSYYIQLWRYSEDLRRDITEMLKSRYFKPWMTTSNSLLVYERDNNIKYGNAERIPFFVSEVVDDSVNNYIQFKYKHGHNAEIVKLQLPSQIK